MKAPKIVNLVFAAFVVALPGPARAGGELGGLAAGEIDPAPYAVAVLESARDTRRQIEIDADGAWRRRDGRAVCRETWEARCWQEHATRGTFAPAEKARWVRAAARLAAAAGAPPPPGGPSVSVVIRRGGAEIGAATTAAAPEFAALWKGE